MDPLERFDIQPFGPDLYRGPQPSLEALVALARRGLRLVVNLRAESDLSRDLCERLRLDYLHLPVVDWSIPDLRQVETFLERAEDPASRPLLVHCFGGVGRTGIFVSCYRIRQGMPVEEALRRSDRETPWLSMNEIQREWVRAFSRRYA